MIGVLATFFKCVHSLEEFDPQQESCYEEDTKNMDELIRNKDKTIIYPSWILVKKSKGPDEIHTKISKSLSSKESFINAKWKLFEKCMVGWLGFYGISTFVGYLTPNQFLCK